MLRPGEVIEGDGAVGVWELVGDVGRDGGAARGDAALGEEDKEPGEELVDVDGGVELGKLGEEFRGESEGIIGRLPNVEISGDPIDSPSLRLASVYRPQRANTTPSRY